MELVMVEQLKKSCMEYVNYVQYNEFQLKSDTLRYLEHEIFTNAMRFIFNDNNIFETIKQTKEIKIYKSKETILQKHRKIIEQLKKVEIKRSGDLTFNIDSGSLISNLVYFLIEELTDERV